MKLNFALFVSFFVGSLCFANDDIDVTIDSIANTRSNAAMEVCGTATHKEGVKPLLVTIKHDLSFYTTLTAPNSQWCVLIKRWTFSGRVEASAATLTNPDNAKFKTVANKPLHKGLR